MTEVRNYSVGGKMRKVTIYTDGAFGITKTEAKLHEYGMREYAQHKSVPYVRFTQKRKRKESGFIQGYRPYIVIVDGWDNPDPNDPLTTIKEDDTRIVKRTRFSSFDDGIVHEFDEKMKAWFSDNENKIIFDKRWTQKV